MYAAIYIFLFIADTQDPVTPLASAKLVNRGSRPPGIQAVSNSHDNSYIHISVHCRYPRSRYSPSKREACEQGESASRHPGC